jgi:hypothetical protein
MINGKQIIIPTMGTLSDIFMAHLHQLNDLKNQIAVLKQACKNQMNEK